MKKLVTVTWSVTIETDLPAKSYQDNLTPDSIIYGRVLNEVWPQVQKGDGEITDVQDSE